MRDMPPRIPIEFVATELLYFLVISGICIYIFLKTKEYYDLTKHGGIYFFRFTFLYFALAFLFRMTGAAVIMLDGIDIFRLPRNWLVYNLAFVCFFSMLAVLSLAVTVFSRKIKMRVENLHTILIFVAVLATIMVLWANSYSLLILIQAGILVLTAVIALISRNLTFNRANFLILFMLWLINVVLLFRFLAVPIDVRLIMYSISITFFLLLLSVSSGKSCSQSASGTSLSLSYRDSHFFLLLD